jgi:hypothetical protein
MKKVKRLCSLILSLAMALSLAQPVALAAEIEVLPPVEDASITSEPETVEEAAEEEAPVEEDTSEEEAAPAEEEEVSVEIASVEEETPVAVEAAEDNAAVEYVLMNIPYADFYKADLNNDVLVDAFSSATLNKTRTMSLAGGSYHVDPNGSDITGIIFPVKVNGADLSALNQITDSSSVTISVTNRGQTSETTYTGSDALFEAASYSYYVLSETPSYYKELTVNADGSFSFGQVVGDVTVVEDGDATLTTETTYGDYQLSVDGLNNVTTDDKVFAVIISTKEGADYGLRHIENIWRVTELAWSTGFTTSVHNCPTSSAHYEAMMGQTISSVTYYTSKGIYEINDLSIYVPVKFDGSVSVADALVSAGETTVTVEGLPSDFEAVYSVDGLKDIAVSGNKLTFPTTAKVGQYTLTVSDKSEKYAYLTASFTLQTDVTPAAYDAENQKLVAAEGSTEEEFQNYISSISSVSVNGTSYAASGRGAVTIIKEDGSIDLEAASNGSAVFTSGKNEVVVSSTGYANDLSFTLDTRTAQTITTGANSYSKTYGAKAFSLNAKAEGALSYKSSNTKVVTVNSSGKVTIKGAGSATITITAAETDTVLAATKTVKVTVAKAAQTVTVTSKYTKTIGASAFTVKASAEGKLSYKSSNTKVVTVDSKGKVTVKGVGTATITVTAAATSNYNKATAKITVTVNPKATTLSSVKSSAKKKLTVKWKKGSSVTGYQIQYSTSSDFSNAKTVTVSKSGTTSKTITSLTSKKKYYVRVRTYKTVDGKKYYSSWSSAKNATVK